MSALSAAVRGILTAGLFLSGPIPLAVAHTDIELQIETITRQLEIDPGNAELLLKRGDLHRRHVDYEAAALDFAAARQADPGVPMADFFEGRLALETGALETALALLGRHLETHPEHAAAWVLHGRAELGSGAKGRAADDFTRAIQLSEKPSPEILRLQILALVADGETDRALAAVDAGLERLPDEVNLVGLGTDISLAAGQQGRAERYLSRLPPPLLQLEQWARRAEQAACLAEQTTGRQSQCRADARAQLQALIADLNSVGVTP